MKAFVTGGSGFVGGVLIRRLVKEGHHVRALARSEVAEKAVRTAGAEAVRGDLADQSRLKAAVAGSEVVFHCAAHTAEWGPWADFHEHNVAATERLAAACLDAKVRRLVHVSTEAVLLDGNPLVQVDENKPLPEKPLSHYGRSKAEAERVLQRAVAHGLDVVIVRPRLVWGKGDTSVLAKIAGSVKDGRFKWVDGGRALTSTCHVDNLCEGMIAAAEKGKTGEIYFLTDGPPLPFRQHLEELLSRLSPPMSAGEASVPLWLAKVAAAACERIWTTLELKSTPPVHRVPVLLFGQEATVNDAKARRELGYRAAKTRAEGLAELP